MGTETDRTGTARTGTDYERQVASWKHERTTTIVLEELADGSWHATQRDVGVHGYGDTAAAAAAEYCRRVDGN